MGLLASAYPRRATVVSEAVGKRSSSAFQINKSLGKNWVFEKHLNSFRLFP